MTDNILNNQNNLSDLIKDTLDTSTKIISKYKCLKTLSKIVKNTTELAIQILDQIQKTVAPTLKQINKVAGNFTKLLKPFKIYFRISKRICKKSEIWKGNTIPEKATKSISTLAKIITEIIDYYEFGLQFFKIIPPVLSTVSTVLDPVSKGCDVIISIFTIVNQSLKFYASQQKIYKYEKKIKNFYSKFNSDNVVEEILATANKKIPSISTKIENKVDELTLNDLSTEFYDEIKQLEKDKTTSRYAGLIEPKKNEDLYYLHEIKESVKKHLLSSNKNIKDSFLTEVCKNNKKIVSFIKKNKKTHLNARKWIQITEYAQSDEAKPETLLQYIEDKKAEKKEKIKQQIKSQVKAVATIVFTIGVLILASVSLFFTVTAPFITFAAAPILLASFTVALSVLSLGKYILNETLSIKKNKDIKLAHLPKVI